MKKIFLIALGFLIFLLFYIKINKEAYNNAVDFNNNLQEDFIINKGDGSTEVGESLARQNLIKSKYYFWYYVWRTGTDSKLQAGVYRIAKNMTIPQMVDKFKQGKIKDERIKLIIPEGFNNDKIIARLKKIKPNLANEFAKIVKCKCFDKKNCSCYGLSDKYNFIKKIPAGLDLEGYLFPDTYFISKNDTALSLVEKFLDNFDKKISQDLRGKIKQQHKTLHQIITLASIVEREVKSLNDRKIVAGIFWQRLKIGQPLGSDATLSYILSTNKIKYNQKDIAVVSPYNTYKNKGLPPGPIDNPGLEVIQATINPTITDYLYFLNDVQSGLTVFSRTNDEHNLNKKKHGL